jgi:hypothetical protein
MNMAAPVSAGTAPTTRFVFSRPLLAGDELDELPHAAASINGNTPKTAVAMSCLALVILMTLLSGVKNWEWRESSSGGTGRSVERAGCRGRGDRSGELHRDIARCIVNGRTRDDKRLKRTLNQSSEPYIGKCRIVTIL